jgi:hypothetical protein
LNSPFPLYRIYPNTYFETGAIFMTPDTQSIDFNAIFTTSDLELSRTFANFQGDAEYAGIEILSAAIKRVDLDDDDDDDDDEEDDDFDEDGDEDDLDADGELDDDEYEDDEDEEDDDDDEEDDEEEDDDAEEDDDEELNLI